MAAKLYLDSSAIVKRYVQEKGTDSLNLIYSKSDAKELSVSFSFWNIGETLGVMDQYSQRGWITPQQRSQAVRNFAGETLRLLMLDAIDIIPVSSSALSECWSLIEKHHIYQADALQIISCKRSEAGVLLSADTSLLKACTNEGIPNANVEHLNEVKTKVG